MRKTLISIPQLSAEWHPTKNIDLNPSEVTLGSGKKVWWIGKGCGHEWDAIVSNRVKGSGCPVCSGKRVVQGINDLATTHPKLAAQWHPIRNGNTQPTALTAGKNAQIWWLGECSHEWIASVSSRSYGGYGCPYCSGVKILVGFNDLATTHPKLAAQWHPTKNENEPFHVSSGTDDSAYWLCPDCLHEWKSSIGGRVRRDAGCPSCSSRKLYHDEENRNLSITHPRIADEWHPTRNAKLTPKDVSYGSKRLVWWLGKGCGHEWEASIDKRVVNLSLCPYCSNQRVLSGLNDLATLFSEIAAEWHPSKNENVTPDTVAIQSNTKYWWLCDKGHEWKSNVAHRTQTKSGCPQCWAHKFVSLVEREVYNTIDILLPGKAQTSNRGVVKGELDIYIPSKNIAIEFNGLYWHSEAAGKDRNYHANKSKACAQRGIHLIHVWEDDWRDRRDIVVRAIAHRLNATERLNEPGVLLDPDPSFTQRYGARTLTTEAITHAESAAFMTANHIQGPSTGTLHTGLRDKDGILRAVFVAKRVGNKNHEGEWRIERYATRGIVPGGFTKLMKFTEAQIRERKLGELHAWVTFSDGSLSDGGLYQNYGFVEDGFIKPDYQYVVNGKRVHKFNYRLKRFRDDSTLQYESGLSERELALINGISRIWDSGKTRWVRLAHPTFIKPRV